MAARSTKSRKNTKKEEYKKYGKEDAAEIRTKSEPG